MSVDLSKITNSSSVAKSKDSVVGIGATATRTTAQAHPDKGIDPNDKHLCTDRLLTNLKERTIWWGRFWRAFTGGCLRNKWLEQKNLLAMAIDSDTDAEYEIRSSVCKPQNCENDRNPYSDFERLFRLALRCHRLPLRRVGCERPGFA